MCRAQLLPCRAERQPALPVEPVGAGLHAPFGPALPSVELGDEREESRVGGIQMPGELRDLIDQLRRGDRRKRAVHGMLQQPVRIYSILPEILATASGYAWASHTFHRELPRSWPRTSPPRNVDECTFT